MEVSQLQKLERRRQKFSDKSRDIILNDPLKDRALLSRANNAGIETLINSQEDRENFLLDLKSKGGGTLEHGLRKLREVVIRIFDENATDKHFIDLVYELYQMSYDFYFEQRRFSELGSLVLSFMVRKLPEGMVNDYTSIYIISLSHVDQDMEKCLRLLRDRVHATQMDALSQQLLRLSLIYACKSACPSEWFKVASSFPKESLTYNYIKESPAFTEMKERCFQVVMKCYNQMPLTFMEEYWFHGMVKSEEINKIFEIVTSPKGTQTIMCRKRR